MRRSLRELRALVTLADEQHFGRAADRLAMAQPQLSALVSRIEAAVGLNLFARRPAVRVTSEGAPLIEAARSALDELERGLKRAQQLGSGTAGLIRVAYVASAMLTDLPLAFRQFQSQFPDVQFDLIETNSQGVSSLVSEGVCDLGFARQPSDASRVISEAILSEPFVLVAPAESMDASDPQAFATSPLILFPPSAAPLFHEQIIAICRKLGMSGEAAHIANGWPAALGMVRAGFGVTVGPSCLRQFSLEGVDFHDLPFDAEPSTLWLMSSRGLSNPAARALAQLLRSALCTSK